MKNIIIAGLLLVSQNLFSQNKDLQVNAGRSFHGTGDMRGYGFSVEYTKYFKERFNWSVSIGSTIHDGTFPIYYEYPAGNQMDGSIIYTTAGFQGAFSVGYNLLRSNANQLVFKVGSILRYQSSSYYDNVVVLYPLLTNLPYPVVLFRNRTPQKTFAVGAMPKIEYKYALNKKFSIGLVASYQFDTNGDNIAQLSLSLGRRF